jgi:hypothetical protein
MLTIRAEQIAAFAAARERSFVPRLAEELRRQRPESCVEESDEALRASIEAILTRARLHGFSTQYDLARFVWLAFTVARDFDTNPRFAAWHRILIDTTLDPRARMERLYARAASEAR